LSHKEHRQDHADPHRVRTSNRRLMTTLQWRFAQAQDSHL